MSNVPEQPTEENDLHAFVDGRLSPERRRAVQDHIEARPELAARVAAYVDQRQALRDALAFKSDEPVPGRLRLAGLARDAAKFERRSLWSAAGARRIAASAAFLAIGALAGWSGRDFVGREAEIPRQTAIAVGAHRVFVADQRRPVEIRADAQDQLVQWLSNRLEGRVVIPDLRAIGLRFMGGRLIATPSGPAAQLMYDDDAGSRVTLFIEPDRQPSQEPSFAMVGGVAALSWVDAGFAYIVTAQSSRDRVASIGSVIRRQLPDPQS